MSGRLVFTGGGWITEPEQRSRRARIIDAHTHVFPPLLSQEEGIPPELRRRIWQFHSREFNNWWRVSDGRHVDRRFLEFDADDIDQMPDVDFRLTDFGKARITVDGEDYEMQFYTPNLVNNELPPERVVGEMNMAGVDVGVLQADHVYGELSAYFAAAGRAYPGRFIGLAQIWEPEANDEGRLARLDQAFTDHGCGGLYFSVEPFSVMQQDCSLNAPHLEALWALVRRHRVPIFWFLDDRSHDRIAMFMRRVAELDEWARRNPDIDTVITHGLVPAAIIHDIGIPDAVIDLLRHANVFGELLFPAKFADYPYPEGQAMLRALRDQVGAEKLVWGSDSPWGLTVWCTSRQSLDFIRVHCDFLDADEIDQILGVNVAGILGIDPYHDDSDRS